MVSVAVLAGRLQRVLCPCQLLQDAKYLVKQLDMRPLPCRARWASAACCSATSAVVEGVRCLLPLLFLWWRPLLTF